MQAVFTPPGDLVVTFDQALVAGPIAKGNWGADIDLSEYECTGALAVGATVALEIEPIGPAVAGRRVRFAPPPFDVVGLVSGVPAPAFPAFPIDP